MSLQNLISNDFQAFQHYAADKQIVLLHPESRLRSMLVAYLLSNSDKPVYYYAMGPNDVNLRAFIDGFTHDLAVQHPVFGRHLFQLWNRSKGVDMDVLVPAFIRDLSELSDDDFLLILDEFDATDEADDVHAFWERIVHHLPAHCQLVINGRSEPRIPWVSLIARGQAVILRDDDIIRDDFYRHDTVENPDIYLNTYGFGPGYVQHDKGEVGEWEGHLPRLLFFFVMDRPVVTRAEICNTFWPDLTIDQAVNVFHVTKRRLHKALGFDALVHQDGYYQINPTIKVDYDVENFTTALVKAREEEDKKQALQLYQQVVDLYGGPFLQGHTEQWIVERREDFLFGYLEAMQAIAEIRLADDRPEQALAILNRAINEHELYEPIHRSIMQLYADLGRRSEAAGHYQKLTGILKENGLKPETETIELYNQLMTQ
jgi:DNA-binding SARP family transcriptional activator